MRHAVVDEWSRRNSPLHRRDARAKVLALAAYLVAISLSTDRALLGAYALLAIFGTLLARLPLPAVLIRASTVLPFSAAFAAATAFSGDWNRAIVLIMKSYVSAIGIVLAAGTTALPNLLAGLRRLGAPRILVLVTQFVYRYLFVLMEQGWRMRMAARSRGARTLRGFSGIGGAVAVLFGRSYERAEGVHRAMLARGFNGELPALHSTRFGAADVLFSGTVAILLISLALLRRS